MMMMMMMMMSQVVMVLLLKHETIERPHRCHCLCDDCRTQTNNDELKFARSRLNSYRALASEAYLVTFSPLQSSHLLPARLTCRCRPMTRYWRRSGCVASCCRSPRKRNTTRLVLDTFIEQNSTQHCAFYAFVGDQPPRAVCFWASRVFLCPWSYAKRV